MFFRKETDNFLAQFGHVLFIVVFMLGLWLLAIGHLPFAPPVGASSTSQSSVTVSGTILAVSNVTLNNASSIVLIANATKTVSVNFTVTGVNGCGNVFYGGGSVTTTLYWSGVSSTCGVADPGANLNNLNCYMVATTTNNCASATSTASANATSTFGVWYFARPTDGTAASSSSATSTMGETSILANGDAGNFGILIAQQATLAQAAAIQSLSFYIDNALGTEHMRLGVYDDDGPTGNPGTKLAETNQLAVAAGWITATTTAQVQLASGTYWLAYEFDTDNIGFRSDGGGGPESFAFFTFTYGAMPATFASSVTNGTAHWSLYGTLGVAGSSSAPDAGNWLSFVTVRNGSSSAASATSTGQELLTLLALAVPTTVLDFGTLVTGVDTSSTNQISTIKNAGNASTTLNLSGTAFTSGADSIATSSQHYATSTFTYGGAEQALQAAATAVTGFLIPPPVMGNWTSTRALSAVLGNHVSVATNDSLYALGGAAATGNAAATTTVWRAAIQPNCALGAWATSTPLNIARKVASSATYNNYIYLLGGSADNVSTNVTSSVSFASVSASGTIFNWTTTTAMPSPNEFFGATAYNSYIYTVGGTTDNGTTKTTTVRFALINSTGSIGSWSTTTAIPVPLESTQAFVSNGYLYVLGGDDGVSAFTSTVFYALINSTGSIGAWISAPRLPGISSWSYATVDNGIAYSFGGYPDAFAATSTVYFSPLGASGAALSWSSGTTMKRAAASFGGATANGYMYVVGGITAGAVSSSVECASLGSRNTYWGVSVSSTAAAGTYQSTVTYTAVLGS